MRSDKPSRSKFKRISTNLPNLAILTKRATPGDIQATYIHTSVWNKSIGKNITHFALVLYLEAPTMVLIYIERAFAGNGEKISLPTTEVLLCAAAGKLEKSKKFWDWTARNAVLLLPSPTDTALTKRETTSEALLKIFAESITDQEAENAAEESDADEESQSN